MPHLRVRTSPTRPVPSSRLRVASIGAVCVASLGACGDDGSGTSAGGGSVSSSSGVASTGASQPETTVGSSSASSTSTSTGPGSTGGSGGGGAASGSGGETGAGGDGGRGGGEPGVGGAGGDGGASAGPVGSGGGGSSSTSSAGGGEGGAGGVASSGSTGDGGASATSSGEGGAASTSTGDGGGSSTSTGDGGASSVTTTDVAASSSSGAGVCTPGVIEPCYEGPAETEGVGLCVGGTRACNDDGSAFGACEDQALPGAEDCTTLDDEDCDGQVQGCTEGHEWSRHFGGLNPQTLAGLAVGDDGNIVVCGTYYANIDFGGAVLTASATNTPDGFIAGFDAEGNHRWSRGFGSGWGWEAAHDVAVDSTGATIVTGTFQSTINLGGGNIQNLGGNDLFVAKLDASGNHVWSKRFASPSDQRGQAVAVDASDNVYFTGYYAGGSDFGGGSLPAGGGADAVLVKLDPAGNHVWSRRYGGARDQEGRALAVREDGTVALLGQGEQSIDFGGGVLTSAGDVDVFVAVFDPAGNHIWSRRFGGAGYDSAGDVTFDAAGNVLVGAMFTLTADMGDGDLVSEGGGDIVVSKFGPTGDTMWVNHYGDPLNQYVGRVRVDSVGDIVVGGRFLGSVDFGGGTFVDRGSGDAFVLKLDDNGNHFWSQRFGGTGIEHLTALDLDASDDILFGGQFGATVDFGGGPFVADTSDAYLVRLAP
jgi:hypothetical protein